MQRVGQLIRARRREVGMTVQSLANAVGCTRSYLSQVENERRASPPSEELLRKIERNLRMEPEALVRVRRWQSSPDEVRREMQDLKTDRHVAKRIARILQLKGVDALHRSGELAKLVDRLSDEPASPGIGRRVEMGGMVPLVNRLMAGPLAEFTDLGYPAKYADEYVSVPGVSDPDAFAARVYGDSMEPAYREGDVVVFSPSTRVREGADCFVRMERDAESTFKRVYFEPTAGDKGTGGSAGDRECDDGAGHRIRLQPLNNRYPPRIVDREEVAAMYPAVYVMRPVGTGDPEGAGSGIGG